MAVTEDTENRTNVDEETPLLIERQPGPESEHDAEEEPKRTSHAGWWAWRVFWFVVVALVIAVFVKGWVDAGGDVEVCGLMDGHAC
jgi:hypothetical protein